MGPSFLGVLGPSLGSGAPGHNPGVEDGKNNVSGWAQWVSAQPGISHHEEGRTHWPPDASLIHQPLPPHYCHLRADTLLDPGLL